MFYRRILVEYYSIMSNSRSGVLHESQYHREVGLRGKDMCDVVTESDRRKVAATVVMETLERSQQEGERVEEESV